ncbi:unnamed protein product [Thelazia callipaeda]|uniref:Uncharacterized protein n=1 Tax=Thelazia callipaeda TaxID=103827 RepID=A0A0N5D603_THECL|nr:unnamed protein product [Thelazia callipaeda]
MKKIVDDIFGEHGAFWQNLTGPFWNTVNAYGPESDPLKPTVSSEPQKEAEKPLTQLPEPMPLPQLPSFCKP